MVLNPPDEDGRKNLKRSQSDVIEISSDDEDQSSSDQHRSKVPSRPSSSSQPGPSGLSKPVPEIQDKNKRYKLEAERLARQRARDPLISNPSTSTDASQSLPPPASRTNASRADQPCQNYWLSTVMTTFNRWHAESSHAIQIKDIIGPQKKRIKTALVSSYVVDLAWIHSLFDSQTRIMVIKHGSEAGTFKVNERENMFICHPPMLKTANGKSKHGCMHIKFFILFYDDFCRVAIPTANAVDFDYEVIENSVWIQDFRPKSSQNQASNDERQTEKSSPFEETLKNLLIRMGVPSVFRKPLEDYDFRSAAVELVVSIQGTHPSNSLYGQIGLAQALKTLGLQSGPTSGRKVELECQGSSIGSLDINWLNNFYSCATGCPPASFTPEDEFTLACPPPISIIFPSLDTVKKSINGTAGGGTIFCNKASWQKADFPTQIFADAISKRTGI